jgi:hypothetical protein
VTPTLTPEPTTTGAPTPGPEPTPLADSDLDGDGWNYESELFIGTDPAVSCGGGAWPADLFVPESQPEPASKLDIQDILSFVAPFRRMDSAPGDPFFDRRWDLMQTGGLGNAINIQDLTALIAGPTGYPPMFGGQRAFGRICLAP